MDYNTVQNIAIPILTSIITGGFVLVFVEIDNRKNRENDRKETGRQVPVSDKMEYVISS